MNIARGISDGLAANSPVREVSLPLQWAVVSKNTRSAASLKTSVASSRPGTPPASRIMLKALVGGTNRVSARSPIQAAAGGRLEDYPCCASNNPWYARRSRTERNCAKVRTRALESDFPDSWSAQVPRRVCTQGLTLTTVADSRVDGSSPISLTPRAGLSECDAFTSR